MADTVRLVVREVDPVVVVVVAATRGLLEDPLTGVEETVVRVLPDVVLVLWSAHAARARAPMRSGTSRMLEWFMERSPLVRT